MQMQASHRQLELPSAVRSKLEAFRRRLWMIKLAEGILAGAFGLLVSYLLVFTLDRLGDTPAWTRVLILVAGSAGLGVWFPLMWHRWVWRTRRLEQVARVVRRTFPRLGDQLLGIIELVQSELEQDRSEALCRAAIEQVDQEARQWDFSGAVPNPRHRRWAWAVGVPFAVAVAVLVLVPAASTNALARWLMPWKHVERYTFAQLEDLPDTMVVPYAEPFSLQLALAKDTAWSPRQGSARYAKQRPVRAKRKDAGYRFALPPQKEHDTLTVSVGDANASIEVQPTTRPELTSLTARVELPNYLQYSSDLAKDVRGGSVSLVKGSRVTFEATATRELAEATVDGTAQHVDGNVLVTQPMTFLESASREFSWRDGLGLSAKEPFVLSINALEDGSPSLSCNKLSREQVVLDEEVLTFEVLAGDDFGVKTIGMQWEGIEDPLSNPHPAKGEKIVSAGGPEDRELEAAATFSAKREGIKPQTLQLRLFTVDYLPDRQRVYSPTYVVHVLTPEAHAIWLTNRLRQWFRQTQDVYEREQRLYETNKELRQLPAEQLDRPENRRRLETQAAAESANARRLSALTVGGEALIKQAARNDQFNVATMETLAEMLQMLKEIAENRMPSVTDLLKSAASAPGSMAQAQPGQAKPSETGQQSSRPEVGVNRDGRSGKGAPSKPGPPSKVPSVVDVESGFNELDDDQKQSNPSPSGAGRLTLPSTVVQGGGPKQQQQKRASPADQKLDQAVEEQEDLLAEFAKVAEELNRILNNLEASTFVKRLKAASRRQLEMATDLNGSLKGTFGIRADKVNDNSRQQAEKLAEREVSHSDNVQVIQEDLAAYYDRVQQGKFLTVLNEMRSTEVVGKIRDVADTVKGNLSGQSLAHVEFWADTLDRWAEQLVGPG